MFAGAFGAFFVIGVVAVGFVVFGFLFDGWCFVVLDYEDWGPGMSWMVS